MGQADRSQGGRRPWIPATALVGQSRRLLAVIFATLVAVAATAVTTSARAETAVAQPANQTVPFSFEPNVGQAPADVQYLARTGHGGAYYFTSGGVVVAMPTQPATVQPPSAASGSIPFDPKCPGGHGPRCGDQPPTTAALLQIDFLGSAPSAELSAGSPSPTRVNYFLGNDPSRWHSNLTTYSELSYGQLYPGVDLHYGPTTSGLKGTYTVAPLADPQSIAWRYEGGRPSLAANGDLEIPLIVPASSATKAQTITVREAAPIAWQSPGGGRRPVTVSYRLLPDNAVGFNVGQYDPRLPLTIDPELTYSTYVGGVITDYSYGLATDTQGNAYISGITFSPVFPTGPGSQVRPIHSDPYQSLSDGIESDAFIASFDSTGSTLRFVTFLGGSSFDEGYSLALDSAGNIYVGGGTSSTDFPLVHPFQSQWSGGDRCSFSGYLNPGYVACVSDGFVAKVSSDGGQLLYSTYLGGYKPALGGYPDQNVYAIAVDATGHAYVTGYTTAGDFPTANAYQGNNAIYHSTTGPPDCSSGFSVYDAFLSKFSVDGSSLDYSTYLGGYALDFGEGVAVDSAGEASVVGESNSDLVPGHNFPTQNAYQAHDNDTVGSGGCGNGTFLSFNGFLSKFAADGRTLIYSTWLGGSGSIGASPTANEGEYGDAVTGIVIDQAGETSLTGFTSSSDFPTVNPYQPSNKSYRRVCPGPGGYPANCRTAFLSSFSADGQSLLHSTYLGGTGDDFANSIALDSAGAAYLTGQAGSSDFPTQNALFPTFQACSPASYAATVLATCYHAFVTAFAPSGASLEYSTYLQGTGLDLGTHVAADGTGVYVTGYTDSTDFPTTPGAYQKVEADAGLFYDGFLTKISAAPASTIPEAPFGAALVILGSGAAASAWRRTASRRRRKASPANEAILRNSHHSEGSSCV